MTGVAVPVAFGLALAGRGASDLDLESGWIWSRALRPALVVQGYAVSAERAGIDVPEGELLVEIPFDLLVEAARNLT